jgi:hypothetical protein
MFGKGSSFASGISSSNPKSSKAWNQSLLDSFMLCQDDSFHKKKNKSIMSNLLLHFEMSDLSLVTEALLFLPYVVVQ